MFLSLCSIRQELSLALPYFLDVAIHKCNFLSISEIEQHQIKEYLQIEDDLDFYGEFNQKMVQYLRKEYNSQQDPRTVSELFANSFFNTDNLIGTLASILTNINESIHKFYTNKKNQLQYLLKKQSITTHTCFCSRKTNIPITYSDSTIQCLLCNGYFHLKCINLSKTKTQFTCPDCTLYQLDPLHKIIEIIVQPQLFKPTKDYHCKTIKFATNNPIKNQSVEIRCLRLDDDGGDEQITWPDLGELQLNGRRLLDFRPLHKNSSLKKRKDEKFTTKDYLETNTLILKETKGTKDQKAQYRIEQEQTYVIAVYLVQILTASELIHQIKEGDENIIQIENSRNLISTYIAKFSGVQANGLSLSLQCPFDRTLIQTPARGNLCEHIQCFSLENFIKIMEKITPRKWRCPICKFKCFQFQIDSYQQMILNTIRKYKLEVQEIGFDEKANITNDELKQLLKTEEIEKEKQPIFSLKQRSQVVISLDSDPEPNVSKKPKLQANVKMITIE